MTTTVCSLESTGKTRFYWAEGKADPNVVSLIVCFKLCAHEPLHDKTIKMTCPPSREFDPSANVIRVFVLSTNQIYEYFTAYKVHSEDADLVW